MRIVFDRPTTWIRPLIVLLGLVVACDSAQTTITSDREIFIRVNQLGYLPQDAKSAVAFSRAPLPPNFALIDSASQRTVFNGTTKPIAGHWGQFDYQVELNLPT
jgi:hypothetical protein